MSHDHAARDYAGNPAENYERYFVPAIGAPVAEDLIAAAAPRAGERILDVACGTGVVTRMAAQRVGPTGSVAGLDVNPGMLAAARAATPAELPVVWHQGSAEAMPLPDAAFDLVLCQMGLQFMADRPAALRNMRRVAATGGRLALNLPGPAAPLFEILEGAFARHLGPQAAGFVHQVFALHDSDEIRNLIETAGFRDAEVRSESKGLQLPAPRDFLWQYVFGTPLAAAVPNADDATLAALEREVVSAWQPFISDGGLQLEQPMVIATARA